MALPTGTLAGKTQYAKTSTCVPPHLGADGRYLVWVHIPKIGYREIPCRDVKLDRPRPLTEAQREYFKSKPTEAVPCNG